jgi:hypothetical protein
LVRRVNTVSEPDVTVVWVHLFGGEQDGLRIRITIETKPPAKVYVWRGSDGAMITGMTVEEHRMLQDDIGLMAYEFHEEIDALGERELRYRRAEEVVPGLVEVEVAVPRSRPAVW